MSQLINNLALKTEIYLIIALGTNKTKIYSLRIDEGRNFTKIKLQAPKPHTQKNPKVAILLAFLFSFFVCRSQITSPDLRCLKVLNAGEVVLTWAIPPDPNNQFEYYVIYSSTFKSGPYSAIDSIYTFSTSTYTHLTAQANTQSKYYFMRTKLKGSAYTLTKQTDTLRSIWLNLLYLSGAKDLKIQYNQLHDPKLVSSSSFTISKEYPAGTWSTLRVLKESNYADTISVCTASLNYKVSMNDFLGCVSESNISGGLYGDTKSPEEPLIDSISVLPNGNTVLAWKIPLDKDIVKYEIQYLTSLGTNSVLGVVNGRNNTLYTYTNTAATLTNVSIYLGAIDSCSRGSTLNYSLSTMFLQAKYYTCDYKTDLTWNPYISMPGGLKEYQVFYSENGTDFTKITSTTLTAYTHTSVTAGKSVSYFIRAINNDKSITSSSNRVKFESYQVKIPNYLYVPSLNVKGKSSIQVSIFVDTSKEIKGVDVLRSDDGITFKTISFLPFIGSPTSIFEDENVEPFKKSYYYKLLLRDSCNNVRFQSNVSKSILLKVEDDKNNIYSKHLSWSEYEGFAAGVKNYKIYRVVNDLVEPSAIGTTSAIVTEFSDNVETISNQGSKIEYFVEANESGTGNPYGITAVSNSNRAEVYMEDALFIPTAFAPNGKNTTWKPITTFVDKTDFLVRVFDRWGHEIYRSNSANDSWDGGNFPGDVYVYLISYKNSRGEYKEAKGTLLLMR